MRCGEMIVQPGHLQHPVEKCRTVVEMQLYTRLSGAALEQKQAGKGRRVQKCQRAEVEVQVDQVDLPRE